ncbi:MAG TPA: GWxTD domain-containing protein [Acidobacteriota bacterium]|jgi:GWxTD domain-containing protein
MKAAVLILFVGAIALPASVQEAPKKAKIEEESLKQWLNRDVTYIITSEERDIYKSLTTNEEREAFIEQFWLRRDPDPNTSINEFKEEHYRRLAYANDHYSTGMPGWKTDRGRIYILHGPPTGTETHGAGETYYRPRSEGGGVTSTFAFETWYYRHIDGVGDDIYIEFVDKSMSGHYQLAMDEMEKDMLTNVPNVGLTWSELRKGGDKSERLGTRYFANEAARRAADPMRSISARNFPFQRYERLAKLQRPPQIRYKDLENAVSTQLHYDQLPFQVRVDRVRVAGSDYLVPITFYFDRTRLSFKRSGPITGAELNVYGRVETVNKMTVYAFDDDVNAYFNVDDVQSFAKRSVYQRNVPLKAGRYKLTAIVKDTVSGKLGTIERGIYIPSDPADKLDMSDIILADQIFPTGQGEFISDPFVLASVKVYPNANNEFRKGKPLGFYFELYNVAVDQQSLNPSLKVDLRLSRQGKVIETPFQNLESRLHSYGDRYFMAPLMNTEPLEPGKYTLTLSVKDQLAGVQISKSTDFTIVAGAPN